MCMCVCVCVYVCVCVRDDIAQVWASSRVQELIPTNEELPVDSGSLQHQMRQIAPKAKRAADAVGTVRVPP